MKYAAYFKRGGRHNDTIDELILTYSHTEPDLIRKCQKAPENQTIVANVNFYPLTKNDIEIFKQSLAIHPSFKLLIPYDKKLFVDSYEMIKEAGIPFFFNYHCNTKDKVIGCLELGAAEVYITDELGFEMRDIAEYVHQKGARIRVFPNVAQSTFDNSKKISYFFIRPDDELYYEDIVDIFEFYGSNVDVAIDIYKSKKWIGNLKDVILDLQIDVDNRYVVPYFGGSRTNCKKRCMYNLCRICDNVVSLDAAMKNNGMAALRIEEIK